MCPPADGHRHARGDDITIDILPQTACYDVAAGVVTHVEGILASDIALGDELVHLAILDQAGYVSPEFHGKVAIGVHGIVPGVKDVVGIVEF